MALVIILDLTQLLAWEDLPLIWEHKYSLLTGGNLLVVCNSTDEIGSVAFNGIKLVGVDFSCTLYFCFRFVTYDWMSSAFEMLLLFWLVVICLLSSLYEIYFRVELLSDYLWEAEDDKTGFLIVGVDIFDWLCL